MKRLPILFIALPIALTLSPALGQQLVNGGFEQGGYGWTNHPITTPDGWLIADVDSDTDKELVMDGTQLTNASQGVLFIQDLLLDQVDLDFGMALRADVRATNLNGDCRAFIKMEFGNEIVDGHGGSNIPDLVLSSEYDPATYASTNDDRSGLTLVKSATDMRNQLSGLGATLQDVKWARATLFLLRNQQTNNPTGSAIFDNVSFGLISDAYDVPGIPNGGFEYNSWGWSDNPITSTDGATFEDINGDGDKELVFDATGLTNQFNNHIFVWETDAKMIDFTPGISLTMDIGATNLAPDMRVFAKLEFGAGPPANQGGGIVPGVGVSGETDPGTYATNNDSLVGVTLTMPYSTLTNQLATLGLVPDDLTFVRTVLFLFQFGPDGSPAYGQGWFDNLKLNFAFRAPPDVSAAQMTTDGLVLSWDSEAGKTYRVQELDNATDYRWSNIVASVSGVAGTTGYTNPLSANSPHFVRVVRNK